MSVLNIKLIEFKALGSTDVKCGYLADLDGLQVVHMDDSWASFKEEFPTKELIAKAAMAQLYFMQSKSILCDDDEAPVSIDHCEIEGAQALY
jgi:hypothetical protein